MWPEISRNRKGFRAGARRPDVEAHEAQSGYHQIGDIGFVLDDEQPLAGGPGRVGDRFVR